MSIIWEQTITAHGGSSYGGAATVSITPGGTIGRYLATQAAYFQGGSSSTPAGAPTDSNGSFGLVSNPNNTGNGSNFWVGTQVSVQSNPAAGTHTVTLTVPNISTNAEVWLSVTEYSGVAATSSLDVATAASNTTTTGARSNTSVSTGTLGGSNDVILATIVIGSGAGANPAYISDPPTGYTRIASQQDTVNLLGYQQSYKIKSNDTSAEQVQWTWGDTTVEYTQSTLVALLAAATPVAISPGQGSVALTGFTPVIGMGITPGTA
jgi:hypothetical protein